MSQQWWKDDDQLLAALGAALRSERTVPAGFTSTGKAAFSRRGIDCRWLGHQHHLPYPGLDRGGAVRGGHRGHCR
jgi:hypothetical protein